MTLDQNARANPTIDQCNKALKKLEVIKRFAADFEEPDNKNEILNFIQTPMTEDPFNKEELVSQIIPKYQIAAIALISAYEKSLSNLIDSTDIEEDELISMLYSTLKQQLEKVFVQNVPTLGQIENDPNKGYIVSSLSVEVTDGGNLLDYEYEADVTNDLFNPIPDESSFNLQSEKTIVKMNSGLFKKRICIPKDSRTLLEAIYHTKQTPNRKERNAIAERCGLTPLQVRVWFTNKRMRSK